VPKTSAPGGGYTANCCVVQELEQQHEGQHVLLVSHGDTLSILQATLHGTSLAQHRQYGLGTAELKQLNGSGSSRRANEAIQAGAEVGVGAVIATKAVVE
jgi:broad specificity phosphatase PhoE